MMPLNLYIYVSHDSGSVLVGNVWNDSLDSLDPSIEEMKFQFGEHKKTHPKHTLVSKLKLQDLL